MKSRNQKLEFDCTGDEITFPGLEPDDTPDVGDEILINDESNQTGECLMPDLRLIKSKDGIVTSIEQIEPSDSKMSKFPIKPEKTLKCQNGSKIEIFAFKHSHFKIGNKVLINGKSGVTGRFKLRRVEMFIGKGVIKSFKFPETPRKVFKDKK
ncbi:MAG: hypothetical protein KDK44_00945 [Chlamydiia bacterium]|nr:hypothetical protein [Aequorivita sp.]MCB1108207.1 hypothetical protein [Chlamydiia bacterium]